MLRPLYESSKVVAQKMTISVSVYIYYKTILRYDAYLMVSCFRH